MEKLQHYWSNILLFLATILLFIPGFTGQFSDYQTEIWNLGHMGYFFLLITSLFPHLQRRVSSLSIRLIAALLITLLLSGVIEMVQLKVGRQASMDDVFNNLVGSLLALYFCQLRMLLSQGARWGVRGLLILLLSWSLTPLFSIAVDTLVAYKRHPIVADFEMPFERLRWSSKFPLEIIQDGSNRLQVHLRSVGQYPGVTFTPRVSDWRGYSTLQFEMYNSSHQAWKLHFRANDRAHDEDGMRHNDRFNTTLQFKPGWNQFRIDLQQVKQAPSKRSMNMEQISKVVFFFMDEPSLSTIQLDNIILSND
ncbi:MAG: VanZ family protein [Candidatus Polarisedimenticolaceae bacterium]|nr:VanZ family protein [Candidatus Polarisedimenticolaceae bacterium]